MNGKDAVTGILPTRRTASYFGENTVSVPLTNVASRSGAHPKHFLFSFLRSYERLSKQHSSLPSTLLFKTIFITLPACAHLFKIIEQMFCLSKAVSVKVLNSKRKGYYSYNEGVC
ncbi:MAG TPA: hypothetical protein VGE06_04655 [Flavisolibacter sp.]